MTEITLINGQRRRALLGWRNEELTDLFAALPVGTAPSGRLHGRLFAVAGLQRLPRPLASGLYRLLGTPLNPWRGKSFIGERGSNHWGWLNGPGFGHYRISQQAGPDGQPSLWLDYNQPENLSLLRSIRGEARHLSQHQWLCRMLWQGKQGYRTLLWFVLEDSNTSAAGSARMDGPNER